MVSKLVESAQTRCRAITGAHSVLWPEPRSDTGTGCTSADKDTVENKLKTAVCDGQVTLSDAQNAIMTDWTTALSNLGLS